MTGLWLGILAFTVVMKNAEIRIIQPEIISLFFMVFHSCLKKNKEMA